MQQQSIDYDALEKKVKSQPATPTGIDYDALEKKVKQQAEPNAVWEGVKNVFGPTVQNFNPWEIAKGLGHALLNPVSTYHNITDQMDQSQQQGLQNASQGHPFLGGFQNSMGHIPIIGPQLSNAAQEAYQGDYTKATGDALGVASGLYVPEVYGSALKYGAELSGLDKLPGRVVNMSLGTPKNITKSFGSPGQAAIDNNIWFPVSGKPTAVLNDVENQLQQQVKNLPGTVDPMALDTAINAGVIQDGKLNVANQDSAAQWNTHHDLSNAFMDANSFNGKPVSLGAEDLLGFIRKSGQSAFNWQRETSPNRIPEIRHQQSHLVGRQALEDLATNADQPSVIDTLKQEQGLLGLQKAVENFGSSPASLRNQIEVGTAAGGFLTGNPQAGIETAVAMHALHSPNIITPVMQAVTKTGQIGTSYPGMLAAEELGQHPTDTSLLDMMMEAFKRQLKTDKPSTHNNRYDTPSGHKFP